MPTYKSIKAYDAGGDISKEWFVYYYYLKPEELRKPNESIYERFRISKTLNSIHNVKERRKQLNDLLKAVKQLLNEGFNPYKEYKTNVIQYAGYNVCTCIDKYIASIKSDLRDKTYRNYKERLAYFKRWLALQGLKDLNIFDIRKQHVFEFLKLRQITGSLANKTYNHYLQALSTFFQYYIDNYDDYLKDNPCDKIRRLQVTKRGNRPLDNHDFPKVLEYTKIHNPFLYQFCRFLYYSCMRPNTELRLLKISDIDIKARRLTVPSDNAKSKITQVVPIDDPFASILEEMELDQYPRHFYIFGKDKKPGSRPVHDRYFTKYFKKIKTALDLNDEVKLYAFKHTRVIHLVEDGEKLHNIIKLTRHSTLSELMDYLKDMGVIIGETINLKSRTI